MRGVWLVAASTLFAIGIGVGVEATHSYGPPATVSAAIEQTMAVSSIEIQTEPTNPLPNVPVMSPDIFNAPNRFEIPQGILGGQGSLDPTIFIGDQEYVSVPLMHPSGTRTPRYINFSPVSQKVFGATSETMRAFTEMQALRMGSDFRATPTGYRFRLSVD